jgi:hypothetical protein
MMPYSKEFCVFFAGGNDSGSIFVAKNTGFGPHFKNTDLQPYLKLPYTLFSSSKIQIFFLNCQNWFQSVFSYCGSTTPLATKFFLLNSLGSLKTIGAYTESTDLIF